MLFSTQAYSLKSLNFLTSFSVVVDYSILDEGESWIKTIKRIQKHGVTPLLSISSLSSNHYDMLKAIAQENGFALSGKVIDPRQIDLLIDFLDVFQVDGKQMYNYELLKELGKTKTPTLLQKAPTAYRSEFISAADYLISAGNSQVILCEKGSRNYEQSLTLDFSSIPYLQRETGLPVFIDPSGAYSDPQDTSRLCFAAAAIGAQGVLLNGGELNNQDLAYLLNTIRSIQKMVEPRKKGKRYDDSL